MADGRLGQTEAVTRGSEAAKIPDRKKDPQQVEVKMVISLAHTKNYNYEFDLVQAARHRAAIGTRFDTAAAFGAGKGCGDAAERASTVSVVRIREMWNE